MSVDCSRTLANAAAVPARFLASNYKQALETVVTCTRHLEKVMPELGIASVDEFRSWHEEEFEYLRSLQGAAVEPDETWKEEYVELLIKLDRAE